MIPCGNMGHGQTPSQSPATAGPQTQIWPSEAAQAQMSPWQHRLPDHYGPGGSRYQVAVQTLDICTTLGGNRSHGHESRSWLLVGHGHRRGPKTAVQAWTTPWPHVAVKDTQVSMVMVAAWPSGTNMAIGCGLDPRHLCGL